VARTISAGGAPVGGGGVMDGLGEGAIVIGLGVCHKTGKISIPKQFRRFLLASFNSIHKNLLIFLLKLFDLIYSPI
jgi:hypothetical protein